MALLITEPSSRFRTPIPGAAGRELEARPPSAGWGLGVSFMASCSVGFSEFSFVCPSARG
jgi:hypothetical protein